MELEICCIIRCLFLFATPAFSQFYHAPATLSIFGPLSTNLGKYDMTINHFCIGLINCSSLDLEGFSIAYGYNGVERDLKGVGIGLLGNYSGNNTLGAQIGWLSNFTRGDLRGMQFSLFNYTHGSVGGLQFGVLNITGGGEEETGMAVQFGIINFSNQPKVIPFGVLSLVRGGRFSVELSRDPVGYNRATLLTGSRYFYILHHLDGYGINPSKQSTFYPYDRSLFSGSYGLGGAIPVREDILARVEYQRYSPTDFERDDSEIWRLLAEYEVSPYFTCHAGFEDMDFRYSYRSSSFRTYDRLQSLTAGVALNLLGWWR